MSIADVKKAAEQKMARSVESFKNEIHKIRTGRAHPGILDQVQVDYYGSNVPLTQVANVTLLDARTMHTSVIRVPRDPACPVCSGHAARRLSRPDA